MSEYDDVNGVIPEITIDLMVNEWEGGNEDALYANLCELAKSHEVLRKERAQLRDSIERQRNVNDQAWEKNKRLQKALDLAMYYVNGDATWEILKEKVTAILDGRCEGTAFK